MLSLLIEMMDKYNENKPQAVTKWNNPLIFSEWVNLTILDLASPYLYLLQWFPNWVEF